MEITRTVQIQITIVGEMEDNYEQLTAEDVKREVYDWLVEKEDADQVLVEVKDFIRDGDTSEAHQN